MTVIRVSTTAAPGDYKSGLIPAICKSLGYQIQWVKPKDCDLLIIGPFQNMGKKKFGWCPKPLRPLIGTVQQALEAQLNQRSSRPLTLFQTGENIRPDRIKADYSISFDLGISDPKHFRAPYWIEMVDWSGEGITGNQNPRYGRLLDLDRLMQPLGDHFLKRPQIAAIFASHLREPRGTLLKAVKAQIEVKEFGMTFNPNIKNHLESGIIKYDELQNFAFNLCPENGMFPGYYTEKIPEAFMAGCLPITWADDNVRVDFNPNAFINLAPMSANGFADLGDILHSKAALSRYSGEALLNKRPTLDPLKHFLSSLLKTALS
jgi:hypothetical protein